MNAQEAMDQLAKKGVGTRPFFYPMHQQPVLKQMGFFINEAYPIAENLGERGFYLPSGLALEEKDMHIVANTLKEILR